MLISYQYQFRANVHEDVHIQESVQHTWFDIPYMESKHVMFHFNEAGCGSKQRN